jgi:hypothetical protein
MTGTLTVSEQEFKATIINMLKTLREKVDNMQEETGNTSREIGILSLWSWSGEY